MIGLAGLARIGSVARRDRDHCTVPDARSRAVGERLSPSPPAVRRFGRSRGIRPKGLRALHEREDRARLPTDLVSRIRRILLLLQGTTIPGSADAPGFRVHSLKGGRHCRPLDAHAGSLRASASASGAQDQQARAHTWPWCPMPLAKRAGTTPGDGGFGCRPWVGELVRSTGHRTRG